MQSRNRCLSEAVFSRPMGFIRPFAGAVAAISSIMAVAGCSRQIKVKALNDPNTAAYIASFDATRRGSVIKFDKDGNMTVVSEVPPDAVVTSVMELSAKVGGKLDAAGAAKFTESVTALGRRTVAVNILRDALYRLGEMQSNKTLSPEARSLFEQIVRAAVIIALAEAADSEKDLAKQKTQLLKELEIQGFNKEEIQRVINP